MITDDLTSVVLWQKVMTIAITVDMYKLMKVLHSMHVKVILEDNCAYPLLNSSWSLQPHLNIIIKLPSPLPPTASKRMDCMKFPLMWS